jgi:hypothetical protein
MTSFTNSVKNYPLNADTAIRRVIATRDPTFTDDKNYNLGDEWLNKINNEWWKLAALNVHNPLTGGNALWTRMSGSPGNLQSLSDTANTVVFPDGAGNIKLTQGLGISILSNPALNLLTFTVGNSVAIVYSEDVGTATAVANILNINGGTGINTSGAGNTITINANADIATTYTENVGVATPALNNLNILGGTGIATVGAGSTVTINAAASVPLTFNEDIGSAVAAANAITVTGANGITTLGAGNTITINAGGTIATTYTTNAGVATPALNNLNILGAGGITTSGAGSTVTITAPAAPTFIGFSAENAPGALGVTGNGAVYQIIYETVNYDTTGGYNAGTGVFTAGVTGKYQISAGCLMQNVSGAASVYSQFSIITTARTYRSTQYSPNTTFASSGGQTFWSAHMSYLVDMAAGDTAFVTIAFTGGIGNTVDLSNTNTFNRFTCVKVG